MSLRYEIAPNLDTSKTKQKESYFDNFQNMLWSHNWYPLKKKNMEENLILVTE